MTTAHHSASTGNRGRRWLPRQWALRHEGRLSVIYMGAVLGVAITLGAGWGLRTNFTAYDAMIFIVLVSCAAICIEGMRRLGELTGAVHELLLAWTVPVALLLPPVYALLFQLPLGVIVQVRLKRGLMYRRVFTSMAKALAGMVAATAFHLALPQGGALGEADWQSHLGTVLPLALACGALCIAISEALIGLAIRLSAPDRSARVIWDGESIRTDVVELSVGLLIAVGIAIALPLALLAVPPVLLMQRSLVHTQLREAARTDAKTGLLNAGTWQIEADSEVSRAQRRDASLALLLVDIDHFKRVNDEHGHLLGDQVLASVAETMGNQLRDYDLLGRFGGEEFVVLLPDADTVEAYRVAERLRTEVGHVAVTTEDSVLKVTVSVGVALLRAHGKDLLELIAAADLALYHAKASGRDRVCLPAGGALDGSDVQTGGAGTGQATATEMDQASGNHEERGSARGSAVPADGAAVSRTPAGAERGADLSGLSRYPRADRVRAGFDGTGFRDGPDHSSVPAETDVENDVDGARTHENEQGPQ